MKTNYSTIILRYVHDVVTGEFANIGVVLYAPDQRFLEARFTTSYERLNAIFLKIDQLHFRALMRYLTNRFEELGAEIRDDLHVPPVNALSEIVKKVLPPDDSSLQWSQQGGGITDDPARVLGDTYKRLVERFVAGATQVSRSDEEIAKPFKAKLGRMVEKLSEKTGGLHFRVSNGAQARDAVIKAGRALRNEYVIGYRPPDSATAGKWRRVRVKANVPEVHVYARNGYYSH